MVRHTGEDCIDVKRIAIATVLSLQASGMNSSKFDAPEADGLSAESDAPFGEAGLDIAVAEIESVVQPDCVADDIGRESVALIASHLPILSI